MINAPKARSNTVCFLLDAWYLTLPHFFHTIQALLKIKRKERPIASFLMPEYFSGSLKNHSGRVDSGKYNTLWEIAAAALIR